MRRQFIGARQTPFTFERDSDAVPFRRIALRRRGRLYRRPLICRISANLRGRSALTVTGERFGSGERR